MKLQNFVKPFQVAPGSHFRLKDFDPAETLGLKSKERAEKVAFVKGDDAVRFADVARAIDVMRGSGIDKVGLITANLEAGK
jgi:biopolymer transport protein ExbD